MSKNRNYTNYSNANKCAETEDSKITEPQNLQKTTENTETTNTNTTPEPQTTANDEHETKSVFGTVVNCEKLNVRSESSVKSEVLFTINKGEEVEIVEDKSTDDFYAVIFGNDKEVIIEGYCMKKYIKINK